MRLPYANKNHPFQRRPTAGAALPSQRCSDPWGGSAVISSHTPARGSEQACSTYRKLPVSGVLLIIGAFGSDASSRSAGFQIFQHLTVISETHQKKSPRKIFYLVSKYIKPSDKALFKYIRIYIYRYLYVSLKRDRIKRATHTANTNLTQSKCSVGSFP